MPGGYEQGALSLVQAVTQHKRHIGELFAQLLLVFAVKDGPASLHIVKATEPKAFRLDVLLCGGSHGAAANDLAGQSFLLMVNGGLFRNSEQVECREDPHHKDEQVAQDNAMRLVFFQERLS